MAIITGSTGYGLCLLLPGALLEAAVVGIGPVTVWDALLVLYLGAGCSALAFVLCGYGLARVEAGRGAAFGNLKPLVGLALAILLLGEPASAAQLIGGALIFLGLAVSGPRFPPWLDGRPRWRTLTLLAAPRDGARLHPGGRWPRLRRRRAHRDRA